MAKLETSSSGPRIDDFMEDAWDTVRLCESLASLRSIVQILNMGITEVLLISDKKEREDELWKYERRLRRCLDEICDVKDEFFESDFKTLISGVHTSTVTSTLEEINEQKMEHEDLWREFLGLYVVSLSFAAKIAVYKQKIEEAVKLYAFVIDACVFSGAYLNFDHRSCADGRNVTISRFRARLASLLFSQCKYGEAKTLAQQALLDLGGVMGTAVHRDDPDFSTCLSIVSFLTKRYARDK